MSEQILIIEDEPDIRELISYNLQQAGFSVVGVDDGEAGLQQAEELRPQMIILDLMLPGMDGLEVCRLLKQRDSVRHIPVMMLTAKAEEVDRIVGLELGADDYVIKPFSPRELVLRVKAILKRSQLAMQSSAEAADVTVTAGPLRIDPDGHQAYLEGEPLPLTATEFKLLLTLAQRRGRVQSRDELLNVVWGYQYSGYGRTVDTHVRRLREKLGTAQDWVETVRGVGYRFRKSTE